MRPANTTLVTLGSELARSFVGFFVTLYLARELGPGVLGSFFVVLAIIVWVKLPVNAIGSALTKRVSEGDTPGAFLGAGGLLYSALAIATAGGILLFSGPLNAHIGAPVASVVALLLIGNALFSYVTTALDGQKQVATSSVVKAGQNIFEGGAQVGFVLLGYEILALIGGQVLALFGAGVVGILLFRVRPALPGKEHVESLIQFARFSWLGTVSGRTFGWMDTLVLSFFVGSGLIGVYEISWRLASVLVLLTNAIQRTLFPEISNLAATGNESKIQYFIDEALFYAGLVAIPGLFGALVLGPNILRIYGAEFTAGGIVLLILILARLFDVYGSQLLNVVNAIDRPDVAFRINGVFMISNLVLNVSLVALFGWHGAAVATALSSFLMAALGIWAVMAYVGEIQLPIAGIGRQVFAGAVMAIGIVLLRRIVPVTSMYRTVGYVLAGACLYGLLLLIISSRFRSKLRSLSIARTH